MINKMRVKLRSFDVSILEESSKLIVDAVKKSSTNTKVVGPIGLPTRIEKFTVLRSPHVDKKSREQFEMRTHKRIIDIISPNQEVVSALTKLEIPSGVDIEIK